MEIHKSPKEYLDGAMRGISASQVRSVQKAMRRCGEWDQLLSPPGQPGGIVMGRRGESAVRMRSLQQFKYKDRMEESFQKGEIVWAKIMGYPWWPGAVGEVFNDDKSSINSYLIKFFGEDSHSTLSASKVAKYVQHRPLFIKKAFNCRKLRESIEVAENIIQGTLSVKEELSRLASGLTRQQTDLEESKNCLSAKFVAVKSTLMEEENQITFHSLQVSTLTALTCSRPVQEKYQLDSEENVLLQELEKNGIHEENVVDILQSGFLKRLMLCRRQTGERLQRIAKKALLRKYFSKRVQKPNSETVSQTFQAPRKKLIAKVPRTTKVLPPNPQVETLAVRGLYQILKSFQIESESSRLISTTIVERLKSQHGLGTAAFQKEYLSFVGWVKHHQFNPELIRRFYWNYFQGNMQDLSKESEETEATLVHY